MIPSVYSPVPTRPDFRVPSNTCFPAVCLLLESIPGSRRLAASTLGVFSFCIPNCGCGVSTSSSETRLTPRLAVLLFGVSDRFASIQILSAFNCYSECLCASLLFGLYTRCIITALLFRVIMTALLFRVLCALDCYSESLHA